MPRRKAVSPRRVATKKPTRANPVKKELPFVTSFGSGWNTEEYAPPGAQGQLQSYEGWVYSCVRKLATTTAQIQFDLFRRHRGSYEKIEEHGVIDLLDRANEFMTYFDLIEMVVTFLNLTGEAFLWKERAKNGNVIGLYPWLLPSQMRVLPGQDRFIKGFVYSTSTGEQVPFDSQDIVYFRFPNPTNPYRGMSPVRAAAIDVDTEKKAKQYNWRFFENNATPRGVITTAQELNEVTFERLKAQFNEHHRGQDNAYKTAILEQGLTYSDIGFSHTDMDFINQRTFSRDAILATFGVPKSLLGIVEDVNRANAEVSKEVFLRETIQPLMYKLAGSFNEQLLGPDFDDELFFDVPELVKEDQEIRLNRYNSLANIGAMSVNEIRTIEGLPTVVGGDTLYKPLNMVPIAETSQEKAAPIVHPTNIQKRGRSVEKVIRETISTKINTLKKTIQAEAIPKTVNHRLPDEPIDACLSRKIPEILRENPELSEEQALTIASSYCTIPGKEKKNEQKGELNTVAKEAIWKIFDLGIRQQVPEVKKRLLRYYSGQEKRVIARLQGKKSAKREDVEKYLPNYDEELTELNAFIQNPFIDVILSTSKETAKLFGFFNAEVTIEQAQAYAFQSIKRFARSNIDTINDSLAKTMIEGFNDGEGVQDIINRVKSVYTDLDDVSAERISRTELTKITSWSNQKVYQEAGIQFKEWQVNPGACEFCLPLAGKILPIGNSFFDKGSMVVGQDGSMMTVKYETVKFPPLHVNCTCNLLPYGIGQHINYDQVPLPSPNSAGVPK